METTIGKIPLVSAHITAEDRQDSRKSRWFSKKRMDYKVKPGLYGVGSPNHKSPILITANYKMTFDTLRKELSGVDAWILVLDTKGINVWCAAGKGTFGSAELISRLHECKVSALISHKTLVLPQLGAPGISAHLVKKETGFTVKYGPVRAADIPEFLKKGNKKTAAMSKVLFPIKERAVLAPMESMQALKWIPIMAVLLLLVNLLEGGPFLGNTLIELAMFAGALVTGTVIAPILLPWIPGRSFALKGWIAGLLFAAGAGVLSGGTPLEWLILLLLIPPVTSFVTLNFTGATTYTSLSGVLKEMKIALPLLAISTAGGLFLKIYSLFP
jgi:hypothetical protein